MWQIEEPPSGFLSDAEKAQVDALFRRLVPSDPLRRIPGAAEAHAVEFLDRLLAMSPATYHEIPSWGILYRQRLAQLDQASQHRYGTPLAGLSDRNMVEFLQFLQAGLLGTASGLGADDQKRFFETLHRHCIQGCVADPRWGGNRDRIIWRWLGYLQPAEEL